MTEVNLARRTHLYDVLKRRILTWAERRLGSLGESIAGFLMLFPDILMLLGRIALDNRLPRHLRVRVGIALTYMTSPLDLLPELALGPLGLLDDIILSAFVLDRVLREVDEEVLFEHWSGRPEQLETLKEIADLLIGIFGLRLAAGLRRWLGESEGVYAGTGGLGLVRETDNEESRVERYRAAGL